MCHRYIVVSGLVGIFLEIATSDPAKDGESSSSHKLLAQFSPESKSPWFGEAAILATDGQELPRRGASAFTLQQTQLLSIHSSKAKRFIEVVPEFFEMNATYQKAYSKTNQLSVAKPLAGVPSRKLSAE